jgi:Lipid A 3-O-deacylase (PagL)
MCGVVGTLALLLSEVSRAYQPGQNSAQESFQAGSLSRPPFEFVVPKISSDAMRGTPYDDLPDAPVPEGGGSAVTGGTMPVAGARVPLKECPYDKTKARECRVHWRQLLISSAVFITWQNTANAYSSYWYRYETTTGNWWTRYVNSVVGYKYSVWSDGNPMLDDYVGHPLMGDITNFLWIQNDPKGMTLEFSNTRPYWISRLRAMGFSAVYSTEWKLGPIGESGVGHQGDHLSDEDGRIRNETGFVSLVTTPVGGTVWTVAEDVMDKYVVRHLENFNRNPFMLMGYSFLTPGHTTGNLLRFRPPWYRDSRTVKANSFWSDPAPTPAASSSAREGPGREGPTAEEVVTNLSETEAVRTLPQRPAVVSTLPGGTHELGAWWGLSLMTGHLWGYAGDVKYMPIDVRYSYRFLLHENWALRYSPEITALAMIDWPTPDGTAPFNLRKRSYGSGLSPEGFQADFFPRKRVQPFLSNNAGFIYFANGMLTPQGSKLVYTVDFGAGVNIFRKMTQVVTIGYRYQHLSKTDIVSNGGTDANIFYVGVSRFRTKSERSSETQ